MFSATRSEKEVRAAIVAATWNARSGKAIKPAERWTTRTACREMPQMSAKKLRWALLYAGTRFSSARRAARRLASWTDEALKPTQKALTVRKPSCNKTAARLHGPRKRWRRIKCG